MSKKLKKLKKAVEAMLTDLCSASENCTTLGELRGDIDGIIAEFNNSIDFADTAKVSLQPLYSASILPKAEGNLYEYSNCGAYCFEFDDLLRNLAELKKEAPHQIRINRVR